MRNGSATKELIGRTALRLFVEKGVAETTIRDIAHAARIAEGTIYRHYASKDDLAWELFADNLQAIGRELHAIEDGGGTAGEKLAGMIRHFCAAFDHDEIGFRYMFLTRHGHLQKVPRHMTNPCEVFHSVIKTGIGAGEFPHEDPAVLATMVLGIIFQLTDTSLLNHPVGETMTGMADKIVAACLRVLARPGGAAPIVPARPKSASVRADKTRSAAPTRGRAPRPARHANS